MKFNSLQMLIQDRIRVIMKSGNLTASEFADKIDVKRSNLSHVLSGRNKPSLDFLEKVINAFPKVNAAWLITGETRKEEQKATNKTQSEEVDPSMDVATTTKQKEGIEKIVVLYKDGTFSSYSPSQL